MARFLVTTTEDVIDANDGVLSLREAILAANETERRDTILISRSIDGPVVVESDLSPLTADIRFDGNGATIEHDADVVFTTGAGGLDLSFEDFATDGYGTVFDIAGQSQDLSIEDYNHLLPSIGADNVISLTGADHRVEIRDSSFHAVAEDGVIDVDSDDTDVSLVRVDMDLEGESQEGVEVGGSNVTVDIHRSTFSGAQSAAIDSDSSGPVTFDISRSFFVGNSSAVALDAPQVSARLVHNTFIDNDFAVLVTGDDASLFSFANDYDDNETAIRIDVGAITQPFLSLFDDFSNNETAISHDSSAGTFTVRFENFDDNQFASAGTGDTDLGSFI